ncbi:MAG: HlyD family secretion protein [Enhydrobacter sp.]|nr:HlyD family secretion protein [Enhydrobacter sp.]
MDGEQPQTLAPPIAVAATRRSRVGGRVVVRFLMWSLPFLAAAAALFFWLAGGRYIATDNAYVKGDRVYVATELSGPIVEVAVRENQRVSRGQLLYRLDDTPYRLALAKIEADIEIQRAEIRGLRAQWRTKREDIKAALSQQVYAQADYERQKDLAERKFAPAAKLEEARMSADVARQRIASAEEELQRIEAQLAGDPKIKVDDHPKVKQMLAARNEALLNLRRTTIEAPLDGIVSKVLVPGSYAVTGVPSVAVVADTDLWIEANFKETELTRVRVGQPVTITIDTYPGMKCTGKVTSLAQSTGAEFSVLPPQNATGNWVKVVQRIPVRSSVQCREGDPPLRVGMSATIEIDTGHERTFGDILKSIGL